MQFDHIFLQPRNLKDMEQFLTSVLALEKCARPAFGFPGAWLGRDEQPWFHLAQGRGIQDETGVIGHVAFRVNNMDRLTARLNNQNIPYHKTIVPGRGEQQIFFNGPEGLTLEAVSTLS